VNFSVLNNLEEIKVNAKRAYVEKEDENLWVGGNETFN